MKTSDLVAGNVYFYFDRSTLRPIQLVYVKFLKRKGENGLPYKDYKFNFVDSADASSVLQTCKVFDSSEVEDLIHSTHFDCIMAFVKLVIQKNLNNEKISIRG
jgi:hypothetical protein